MGIIQRQGIKHSIVTYAGTIIGMLSTFFVYTLVFSKEEIGLYRTLIDIGSLSAALIMVGMRGVSVKFFTEINKNYPKNGFLSFVLLTPLPFFVLFVLLFYWFQPTVFDYYSQKSDSDLLTTFLPYAIIFAFAFTFQRILINYTSNFHRISVPAIFSDFFVKVIVPILGFCYYFQWITFYQFIVFLCVAYLFIVVGLLGYLAYLKQLNLYFDFSFLKNRKLTKRIRSFAFFGILSALGTQLVTKIDTIMVSSILNTGSAGIYAIALNMSTIIEIPSRSFNTIAAPIISKAWEENNIAEISMVYQKVAVNMLIFSVLLLVGVWASVDNIFEIIPNGETYAAGKYVILFLGLAKVVDVATSANSVIINYSKYYRFNLYSLLALSIVNILLNIYLIPRLGINGVAIATLTSMTLYNGVKFLFIWMKFKMQPFSWSSLWVIVLGFLCYGVAQLIPSVGMPFVDAILKSIAIVVIYVPTILYFNFSDDITNLFNTLINKFVKGKKS